MLGEFPAGWSNLKLGSLTKKCFNIRYSLVTFHTLLPNWSPGVELHHDLPSQLTSIKGGRLEYGAFSGLESESTLVACWREMFTFILHKIFDFAIKTTHPLQKKSDLSHEKFTMNNKASCLKQLAG